MCFAWPDRDKLRTWQSEDGEKQIDNAEENTGEDEEDEDDHDDDDDNDDDNDDADDDADDADDGHGVGGEMVASIVTAVCRSSKAQRQQQAQQKWWQWQGVGLDVVTVHGWSGNETGSDWRCYFGHGCSGNGTGWDCTSVRFRSRILMEPGQESFAGASLLQASM